MDDINVPARPVKNKYEVSTNVLKDPNFTIQRVAPNVFAKQQAKEQAKEQARKEQMEKLAPNTMAEQEIKANKKELDIRQNFINNISDFADNARKNKQENKEITIGNVSEIVKQKAQEKGVDLTGYKHTVDSKGIRHKDKSHSKQTEKRQDQIPLTNYDLKHIPDVIYNPDNVTYYTRKGLDHINYEKQMPDGQVFYIEEVRTGKHTLTTKTMYKKVGASDVENSTPEVTSETSSDNNIITDNSENLNPNVTKNKDNQRVENTEKGNTNEVVGNKGKEKEPELQQFSAKDLKTDAKTFQYKEGGDESGITDRLKGVKRWNSLSSGKVIVYETKDGTRYIADGHQRLGLAKRLIEEGKESDIKLDGYLYREVDGYTPADIRSEAALNNLRQGTGTSVDTAKAIRENGGVENIPDDIPTTGEMYKTGVGLSYLSEDNFTRVINEEIKPEFASEVGNVIRENSEKQKIAIDTIIKSNPRNRLEASLIARDILHSDTRSYEQTNLFGTQVTVDSLAPVKAKLVSKAVTELKSIKGATRNANKNSEILEKAKNKINKSGNEETSNKANIGAKLLEEHLYSHNYLQQHVNRLTGEVSEGKITERQAIDEIKKMAMDKDILSKKDLNIENETQLSDNDKTNKGDNNVTRENSPLHSGREKSVGTHSQDVGNKSSGLQRRDTQSESVERGIRPTTSTQETTGRRTRGKLEEKNELYDKAKKLGVKGIKKNMKIDTINGKIREFVKENTNLEDFDVIGLYNTHEEATNAAGVILFRDKNPVKAKIISSKKKDVYAVIEPKGAQDNALNGYLREQGLAFDEVKTLIENDTLPDHDEAYNYRGLRDFITDARTVNETYEQLTSKLEKERLELLKKAKTDKRKTAIEKEYKEIKENLEKRYKNSKQYILNRLDEWKNEYIQSLTPENKQIALEGMEEQSAREVEKQQNEVATKEAKEKYSTTQSGKQNQMFNTEQFKNGQQMLFDTSDMPNSEQVTKQVNAQVEQKNGTQNQIIEKKTDSGIITLSKGDRRGGIIDKSTKKSDKFEVILGEKWVDSDKYKVITPTYNRPTFKTEQEARDYINDWFNNKSDIYDVDIPEFMKDKNVNTIDSGKDIDLTPIYENISKGIKGEDLAKLLPDEIADIIGEDAKNYTFGEMITEDSKKKGVHRVKKSAIELNLEAIGNNPNKFVKTLAHELEHAKQHKTYLQIMAKPRNTWTTKERTFIAHYNNCKRVNKTLQTHYNKHKNLIDKFDNSNFYSPEERSKAISKLSNEEQKIIDTYDKYYTNYKNDCFELNADTKGVKNAEGYRKNSRYTLSRTSKTQQNNTGGPKKWGILADNRVNSTGVNETLRADRGGLGKSERGNKENAFSIEPSEYKQVENTTRQDEIKIEKSGKDKIYDWHADIETKRFDVNKTLQSTINMSKAIAKEYSKTTGQKISDKMVREILPFLRERTAVPEKLGREDLSKFYNSLTKQDISRLTKFADDVCGKFDQYWQNYKDVKGIMTDEGIENHISHIWKTDKKQKGLLTNFFTTNSKFAKPRTIETLVKGIESGLQPRTLDIAEILKIQSDSLIKAAADTTLANEVKNLCHNGKLLVQQAHKAPADWVEIDHPALNKAVFKHMCVYTI